MSRLRENTYLHMGLVIAAAAALVAGLFFWHHKNHQAGPIVPSVADLQPVHAGVRLADRSVRQTVRVGDGALVQTDEEGRARLRLDDGTAMVVGENSSLHVRESGVQLGRGKVFVQGDAASKTTIELAGASVIMAGGNAAIALETTEPPTARIYATTGELTIRVSDRDHPVQSGESAQVLGEQVTVAPERSFEDWTGGLATPWGAAGRPVRALGELWGRPQAATPGDVGSPLTIRSQSVRARVVGETAQTEVHATFFNAGSETVSGDFRMAIPAEAIVSGFDVGVGSTLTKAELGFADRQSEQYPATSAMLEWAGDGWVRGSVPAIPSGETAQFVVRYVEWLNPVRGTDGRTVMQYRFPLTGPGTPPVIGEFSAQIDVSETMPLAISAGQGASIRGNTIELRKSDFRPSADLAVELQLAALQVPARLYAVAADPNDDAGRYVLVRTEAPILESSNGVVLAVVLDASSSMEPGVLDAGRAFVEALARALGNNDQLVAFAANESIHPIGPADLGPVNEIRRKAILDGLNSVAPAGATDLGHVLEQASDLVAAHPAAMVVYVGDGWPSLGELDSESLRARLSRRSGGAPRLCAVAAGPVANRLGLVALARGLGPVLEINDSADAAAAATSLMVEALRPSVSGVRLDLGPDVEQLYPLHARSVPQGATILAVGRARRGLPGTATLRWRDENGAHQRTLAMTQQRTVDDVDVARRWAAERIEEISVRRAGREAAVDVALRSSLLTPWTAFVAGGSAGASYQPTPLQTRVLNLVVSPNATLSASLSTHSRNGRSLIDVELELGQNEPGVAVDLDHAVRLAAKRTLDNAMGAVASCRDSRAALRPDLAGVLRVTFRLDGDGRAGNIRINGSPTARDEAMERCIAAVVEGLRFPQSGQVGTVEVSHELTIPPSSRFQRTTCSAASLLPLPLRRGPWAERLSKAAPDIAYLDAKRRCELPTWSARRTFLELVLSATDGVSCAQVAKVLQHAGEAEAAAFLRREILRRAQGTEQLHAVRAALLQNEAYPLAQFEKEYRAAADNNARLRVVQRYLSLAPHDPRLRKMFLTLLQALNRSDAMRQEIQRYRQDPMTDAGLLSHAAQLLKRIDDVPQALLCIGEMIERAPHDPWARAAAGDWFRNESMFDHATAVYRPLLDQAAEHPAVLLRVALAHGNSGRTDLASRMLARLGQMEGRMDDPKLAVLSSDLAAAMLLEKHAVSEPPQRAELERRILELPGSRRGTAILIQVPAGLPLLTTSLVRGTGPAQQIVEPSVVFQGLGLYRLSLEEDDDADVSLRFVAPVQLPPSQAIPVHIQTLVYRGPQQLPTVTTTKVKLEPSGKPLELRRAGESWAGGA